MANGLEAILARLDREMENRPFFELRILPVQKLGHALWDNGDMSSRYLDAFILAGQAIGVFHLPEEDSLRKRMNECDPYEHPFLVTRVLISSVDVYLREPSEANRERIDGLVDLIRGHLTIEGDLAYLFKAPEGWNSIDDAVFGDFMPYPTYPLGGIILALARYLEAADAPSAEDLMRKLVKFTAQKSGTFTADGHYFGHTHSGGILTAAAGMARWAVHTKDAVLLKQMKGAFDWTIRHSSSWGWIPDGLGSKNASSETCSITDAIHLGLVLARHVDPAYYETVECIARNQLIENQINKNEFRDRELGILENTAIANAFHGSWASWSFPNSLDNSLEMLEGCCLGSGIRGCFLVWDSAVEKRQDIVSVNMAFSRNSPWVEVISHQPYQGRIDIVIHDAPRLQIRMPSWADERKMTVSVNGTAQSMDLSKGIFQFVRGNSAEDLYLCPCSDENERTTAQIQDGYLQFDGLKKGERITVSYPMQRVETCENVNGTEYHVRWRGNTVTGISPKGLTYPIFERDWMEAEEAPSSDSIPYEAQLGGPVHW